MSSLNTKVSTTSYEYRSIDTNPLTLSISVPLWNLIAKVIPTWIPANLLTSATLLFALVTFLLLSHYDFYLLASAVEYQTHPPVPNWLWLFCGLSTLIELALDGIDGIHARRTNTCSRLGEFLDHLTDVWRMTIIHPICLFSIFGRGSWGLSALKMLKASFCIQIVFVLVFWIQQTTAVMFYPWSYDISHYCLIWLYCWTWYRGGAAWWRADAYIFGTNAELVVAFIYGMSLFLSVPMQLWYFYRFRKQVNWSDNALYQPLLVAAVLLFATSTWATTSHYGILNKNPRIFLWSNGIAFADVILHLVSLRLNPTAKSPLFSVPIAIFLLSLAVLLFPTVLLHLESKALWSLAALVSALHCRHCFQVAKNCCCF